MLQALVIILVIAVVAGLIYWVVDAIPVPEPLNRFVKIAVIVVAAIALIIVLLNAGGVETGVHLR